MTSDSAGREVFQHVDPDPDAVLEAHGIDSPDELAGDGAHDPTTDEEIDADDTTAADLFDHLETVSTDPVEPSDSETADEPDELAAIDVDWSFVGEPERTVREDDPVDATAADVARTRRRSSDRSPASVAADESDGTDEHEDAGSTLTVRTADDLELVGPEPTADRVSNESFGTTGFEFGLLEDRC
ncbi:hypothetical protein [Halopiger goleimassiliensis]|uniref:hypothetical protein n=1 Tax=Halopiger goleimassiliensis TaxID=1293048 RepID=UPI0009DC3B99|nr:hypothetical protein [Halopiger goleimassiliensis]